MESGRLQVNRCNLLEIMNLVPTFLQSNVSLRGGFPDKILDNFFLLQTYSRPLKSIGMSKLLCKTYIQCKMWPVIYDAQFLILRDAKNELYLRDL